MKIVKKLGLAGVVGIAAVCAGAAVAADLPAAYRLPVKAVAVAPLPTWTGFYIGGNVGYGWDDRSTGISAVTTDPILAPALPAILAAGFPNSLSPSAKGVIGGGQVGYNWQIASQGLIGLEADLQGSGIKGSANQILSPAFFDTTSTGVTKSIDWFGTVRGRVGLLVTPQWLLYATGGFAYGQAKSSFTTTDVAFGCLPGISFCATGSSSGIRTGWTAGAGAEAMLTPNWSVKVEYLYVDLGSSTLSIPGSTIPAVVFSTSTPFREQIARVGVNYHFDWAGPVVARY